MADTHSLFRKFHDVITLSRAKYDSLRGSRDSLRISISKWFTTSGKDKPKYCWQGSFAMKTLIHPPKDGVYDLDDGVYIQGYQNVEIEDWPTPSTVHDWIVQAVHGDKRHPNPIDKYTCVRVPYDSGYNIDLPIYIMKDGVAHLAHKNEGWLESDPKAIRKWFIEKVNSNSYGEQLRSIVKYMKAWKDYKNIPIKGIAVTILATENFRSYATRDDKSLLYTVRKIVETLENDFACRKPVSPFENLFDNFSTTKESDILEGFKTLKSNLEKAIDESDEKKASEILRKSFGNRFPHGIPTTNEGYAVSPAPGVLRHDGRSA